MRSAWRLLLPMVALVSVAAGCGGTTTSSTSSPSPSPSPVTYAQPDTCTLVTADEASTAAGSPLTNLTAAGGVAIPGVCFYGDTTGKNVGVYVFAQIYPDATTADQVQPSSLVTALGGQLGPGSTAREVSGIGDKAVEYTATTQGSTGEVIFAFKGNAVIMIILVPTTDTSKIEGLAKLAVSRLKPA